MDLFEDFMKLFRKWENEKDNKKLMDILKNGASRFQNLSTSDIGLVLAVLLDDKTMSLLHFLNDVSDKKMKGSIIEGFKLLNFIIQEFIGLLNPYVNGIKKVCRSAISANNKGLDNVKAAAIHCFKNLVKMCPSQELRLTETVEAFITRLPSCANGDRAKFCVVLGSIAKYHPEAVAFSHSNTIFEIIMNDFDEIYSRCGQNLQKQELKNYLNTLNDLLTNFSPQNSGETFEYFEKLYRCIKELSSIDLNQKFKFVSRAAIALLGSHMSLFINHIYNDALFWHNTLLKWTNLQDTENRKVAINASCVYYKEIGTILENKNTENSKKIFKSLMECFKHEFTNEKVNPTILQLCIRGFGHMAGPCKVYFTEKHLASMFSLIARKPFVMYPNRNEMKNSLENVAWCQVALSEILVKMSDVSTVQLTALSKLSLILIKRFPDLPVTSHSLVVTSLMETINNVSKARRRLCEEFIQQLVYEGIIWSCSHTLFIDAEKERKMNNLIEGPVCYKNYLPLWQMLLCPNKIESNIDISAIPVEIFKNMIETCVQLIEKLNLKVTTIETSHKNKAFDIPVAVNDTDFRVFLNLVDLFVDVLEEFKPLIMECQMNWFYCEIIKKSNENPLIIGFYKLVRVVIKLYNLSCDRGEQKLLGDTRKLVSHYLSEIIERSSGFSGELQFACLSMIFEMPVSIAENMLDRLVSTFKTAFSLGQSNFTLAQSALNALEKWTKKMKEEKTKKFLIEVVPSLESFLQSNETAVELQTLPNERKVIKNIVLTDHEKTLQEFQRRILLFFGSLNSDITLNFSPERTFSNEVLRDERNLLEYTLLYNDIKPCIYLDTILPRTIELALDSTDRRTRVVACEVLHSIVTVMLGRKMKLSSSKPDHLLPLFKNICPAILRLGSDSDKVIQQLFYPLMIQLTHWYSSQTMFESSETDCLIETLFDSLTYESNMSLSDFCGVCLAEFVKWSLKQSTDPELKNMKAIVSKITNYALHPSVQKRIGAAVAFNYLYTVLRESDVIIDIFWLEFLFCFIKSLDGCNSSQILKSLKYVERVIDDRYELLNSQSSRRSKPVEFKGTLLKDTAHWLFVQCGSLDRNCRSKSMELLTLISKYVPAFGCVREVVTDYVNRNGVRRLNLIILKDLNPKLETWSVETMKPLLKTLDCYIWILDENLLNLDLLFTNKNVNKDMIFKCIVDFVYYMNVKREENENLSEFTKQYQELCVLKCEIISKIFDFLKILLNKMETHASKNSSSYVPTFFWNTEELYSLMSSCIFEPEIIGSCLENLKIMETLSPSVQQLLYTLTQKLDNKQLLLLKHSIAKGIESYKEFLDFNQIFMNDTCIASKNYLKRLIILRKCNQIDKLYEKAFHENDSVTKVMEIFNLLKKEQGGKVISVDLESDKKEYLENVLEFLCLKFEEDMVITLVNIVDSKTELTDKNSTIILHGEYFMSLFRIPVFRNLLKHITISMDTLLCDQLKDKFDTVLIILEGLLIHVKKNRKMFDNILPILETEFVQRFSTFLSLTNHFEKRRERMINLYSFLVQLSKNPSEICSKSNDLYSWIIQELLYSLDLEHITRIMNSFLPCIVDETAEHKKQELIRCLYKLKIDHYPINMNVLVKGSLEHSNVVTSFQTLSSQLSTLKSTTFFECVIHLTIGNVEYLWENGPTKYLFVYFDGISTDDSRESLQILYKYFMNTESFVGGLEILNKLLIKCIHLCNADAIERFFEQNIKEIYNIVSQDLFGNGSDLKNLIVSKIGCYNLLEIMFAKIPLEKISSVDSTIVKNAIETIETGRELFQALSINILGVRKLRPTNTEFKELIRLLHCAAYNCSIAIVSLKREECFYVLPFAENRTEGQIIWENIVDTNREYEFKQDFQEMPKEYKKLINIRKPFNLKQAQSYSCMNNYNLVASTLIENPSYFDSYQFNLGSQPIGENIDNEELMSLTFEFDDLNNHECMGPICGIITHMISINVFNLPNEGEDLRMPKWMQCFHASLNVITAYNVIFFMIKLIVNMQEAFKPYAKFFFTPTLNFLNLHFQKYQCMNYVIKDILVMLIDWRSVAIPSQDYEKQLAQMLLEKLIRNVDSYRRFICKDNVEIINTLVEAWQSFLEVPEEILNIPNVPQNLIVSMILTFLSNNKQESIRSRPEVLDYLMESFNNSNEEIILHVSNAFGLILDFLETRNERETKELIIKNIEKSVKSQKNHNKIIKYIYEIHRFYPNIVTYCYKQLATNFSKIDNINKEKYLELFLTTVPTLTEEEIKTELKSIEFEDILKNKISTCESVALKIIEKLLNILKPSDYLPFAQLLVPYSKDVCTAQKEIVVNIFIAVYKKYSGNIEKDIAVCDLMSLSRRILLMGLLDANECLQKKLWQFWTNNENVTDKSIDRLLEIFDMYDSSLETIYLPILPLMMLDLVSKDSEFEKKMFPSLIECKFEDYQVEVLWGCQHVAELEAPLFTAPLTQYYSQSAPTSAHSDESVDGSLFSPASQFLEFKQTVLKNQSIFQPSHIVFNKFGDSTENFGSIPQPSKNKKSKRLLENTTDLVDNIRHEQITINMRRGEMLKEQVDLQKNSINIYRKYRIGDFPDTEITHSSLIKPLQELVKNDQVVARDLTVAIFCSMLKEMSPDQKKMFLEKLSIGLKVILDTTQGFKSLIATVLELILNSAETYVSPNLIAKVSKSSGLLSLGALLLEEKMISGYTTQNSDPLPKKVKYDTQTYNEENDWLQLANIYKSMNDFDIVQIIFGSQKFGTALQEASFAQASSKWTTARDAYIKAYQRNEGLTKDYCQESLFICLAHLSDWAKITDHVETELNGDFDALWQKPMTENWMASWTLQAQIHGIVRNDCSELFLEALRVWVNTKDKLTQLKALHGEEMAIFYIDQNPEFPENYLMTGLEKMRQEWKHLNPLHYEQKINKYLKLRGMSDIKTYLKGIKDKNQLIPNVEFMLNFWNDSVPANQDNLLLWDKHITYRLYFFTLLKQQLENETSNDTSKILGKLNAAVVKQCLNIAQVAYSQYNLHFMDKYLQYSKPYLKEDHPTGNNEWRLASAKYKYLCYADSESDEKKVETYIASWKESHNLVTDNWFDSRVQMNVRQHISSLVIELRKLVVKSYNEPISKILLGNPSILEYLPPRHDQNSILKQLSDYCMIRLRECCESGKSGNIAKSYLKVSMYCHSMSDDFQTSSDLSEEYIHSTLSAMRYGSLEATQYFPCLLHLDYSTNPKLSQIFERASMNVETWMFLKWQAQLLSHIGSPICSLIAPILLRLAQTYPNSFIYSFRMTKEMNRSLLGHSTVCELNQILSKNKDLELFLEAMKYVVQPELFLKYHVNGLRANMVMNTMDAAINTLLTDLYSTREGNGRILIQGKIYMRIAMFRERIEKIRHKQRNEFVDHRNRIIQELDQLLNDRIKGSCKVALEEYSPWLSKFSGGNIEVPGQYAGDKKPMPQYHARIVKLNPNVTILPSLRKPIKITMLGNDGNNYNFLLKFGEDLRTDERIEQLFMLMNRILQGDAVCRQSQLSIDAYLVIPLTNSLGLIQWVDNTKSLSEIINSVLTDQEKNERENIKSSYIDWLDDPPSDETSYQALYEKAILQYGREKVTTKFNSLKNMIERDILRKAFKILSLSPESFFAIRHNFITSYATICIAQWVLGIGDRNLANTLISYTSGKALGIDFGYSFDTAVDICIVPELMPFRLTPQIIGLLQPFDEHGLLKVTMMNVLRAMKHGKDPLLACMDIFIREPLLDWLAKRRTLQDRQRDSDVKWYPKKKIDMVADKLNGTKPSRVTILQIKDRYGGTKYFCKYLDVVNGSDNDLKLRVRSERGDENLSTEEQVECLLDQATDPNILGRAWFAWEPWI